MDIFAVQYSAYDIIAIGLGAFNVGFAIANALWTFHCFPSEKKSHNHIKGKGTKGNDDRSDRHSL